MWLSVVVVIIIVIIITDSNNVISTYDMCGCVQHLLQSLRGKHTL